MWRRLIVAGMALGLAGCITAEQQQVMYDNQTPPTKAQKAAIILYVKDAFFDPYSIRDAEISHIVTVPNAHFVATCVKLNSKNRMGGYTGRTVYSMRISNGVVVGALEKAPGCYDPRLIYSPFKELEGL